MWPFKKKEKQELECDSIWKSDFSGCVTADYLPGYSICQCGQNSNCRYVAFYAGMTLCSHPLHKSFIPEGSEPFDPHRNQFRD